MAFTWPDSASSCYGGNIHPSRGLDVETTTAYLVPLISTPQCDYTKTTLRGCGGKWPSELNGELQDRDGKDNHRISPNIQTYRHANTEHEKIPRHKLNKIDVMGLRQGFKRQVNERFDGLHKNTINHTAPDKKTKTYRAGRCCHAFSDTVNNCAFRRIYRTILERNL